MQLTIRKETVCISMVKVLGSGERANGIVAIDTIVRGSLNLSQVSRLVESGRGLVLRMTGAGKSCQGGEVQVAVNHVTLRRQGICQNATATAVVDVRAVLARDTGSGASAF